MRGRAGNVVGSGSVMLLSTAWPVDAKPATPPAKSVVEGRRTHLIFPPGPFGSVTGVIKGVVTSGACAGGGTVGRVFPGLRAVEGMTVAIPGTRRDEALSTQVHYVVRLPTGHPRVGGPDPPGRDAATTSQTFVRPSSAAWLVGGLLVRVSTVSWLGDTAVPGGGGLYSRGLLLAISPSTGSSA